MGSKERCLSILCLGFSIFLFLCMVINFVTGHVGGAIAALGAGFFFLSFYLVAREKRRKSEESEP